MTARRLSLALLALILTLAGCGQGGGGRTPDVAKLPLPKGARIVTQARECDSGANAFCAVELVVADPALKSSDLLMAHEHARLQRLGWSNANADTGEQQAADSPGHKLRVTYATANGDLKGWDLQWTQIHRAHSIILALSHALFSHAATLSMMLEQGST